VATVAAAREVKLESMWESSIRLKPYIYDRRLRGRPVVKGGAPAGASNPSHQGQRAGRAQAGPQGLLLTRIGCPSPLTDKSRDLQPPGIDSHHKIDEPVHARLGC